MSTRIRVLSEHTINQIAAGEVIENPASVVKELVENACDAGASEIVIEIEGGGLQRICIADDGLGMSRDDAILCLERYATSKIRAFEDLLELQTMGFRGEALASIAAVSKLTVMSAQEQAVGTRVEIDAGRMLKVEPCARNRGTTMDVRSLFYNVPARKKFQKSSTACSAEVTRMVTVLSLAYPKVGFTLISQGERVLFAPPAKALAERSSHVLGEAFVSTTSSIAIDEGGFQVEGLIGLPTASRPQRTGQYLFVNQRPIVSPLISYAVKDAYATRLPEGRHPIYVLHLQIPHDLIDINVHPQKKEVRFREEKLIKDSIQRAVNGALMQKEGLTPVSSPSFSFRETPVFSDFVPSKPSFVFQETSLPLQEPVMPVGIHGTYLFLEGASVSKRIGFGGRGIVVVDLVAAHARVTFDAFQKEDKLQSQELLIPLTLEFSAIDAACLRPRLQEMEKLGIGIRSLGETHFIVEALPLFMEPEDVKEALLLMLDVDVQPASMVSCFAKARKKSFMLQEALALFDKLLLSASPLQCPQGKSTMVCLHDQELDKLFKKSP